MTLRRRLIEDEDGSTTPANLVWTLVLLALAGIAIDTAEAFRARSMLQHAADAAALAAAQDLPDTALARQTVRSYVLANLPAAYGNSVADTAQVAFGNWNGATASFVSAAHDDPVTRQDTVHITLSRSAATGNAVGTYLLKMFGWRSWDVHANGVARVSGVCESALANDLVSINSNVSLTGDVCLYGRDGVTLALEPMASAQARIGMLDLADFSAGEFFDIPSRSLFEANLAPSRALMIDAVIEEWVRDGTALGRTVQVVDGLPNVLEPGTAYVVDGDLEMDLVWQAQDVIIAVMGDAVWRTEAALVNTADCRNGAAIGFYATGEVKIEREVSAIGLDIVAGGDIVLDQDILRLSAAMEAGDDIIMMADPQLTSCHPLWSVGGTVSRLLL